MRNLGIFIRKIFKFKQYMDRKSKLYPNQQKIPYINQERGVLTLPRAEYQAYFQTEPIISAAIDLKDKAENAGFQQSQKNHLITNLLPLDTIEDNSPFIDFALNDTILNMVSSYLGFIPLLSYIGVWYSPPVLKKYDSSQLFHCDQIDNKQVKVFINCTDVTDKDGPLTCLTADVSKSIRKKINYEWSDQRQMVSDHLIDQLVSNNNINVLTGEKGTVSMVDTSSCFHFGSRVKNGSKGRLMIVFQYISPYAFTLPFKTNQELPLKWIASHNRFSKIERLVLGHGS